MKIERWLAYVAALLSCWLSAAVAPADTLSCSPIVTFPTTISAPGSYCIERSYEVALSNIPAISVEADNVTIDLNGNSLINVGEQGSQAVGVTASDIQYLAIKNGALREFYIGVQILSPEGRSDGHSLENLLIQNSYYTGIHVEGSNSLIRACNVVDSGDIHGASDGYGIKVGVGPNGDNLRVFDNTINGVYASNVNNTFGIYAGLNIGNSSSNVFVFNNQIFGVRTGIVLPALYASGRYRLNIVDSSVTIPYSALTSASAGDND